MVVHLLCADQLSPPVPHQQGNTWEGSHQQEESLVPVPGSSVVQHTRGLFLAAGVGGGVNMEMFLVMTGVKAASPDVVNLTL